MSASTRGDMEHIKRERDRLLHRVARTLGVGGTLLSFICASIPGELEPTTYLVTLPLFAMITTSHIMIGRGASFAWAIGGIGAAVALLAFVGVAIEGTGTDLGPTLAPLAAAGIASFALVVPTTLVWLALMVATALASTMLVQNASATGSVFSASALAVVLGWALTTLLGYWLNTSVPRAARRIYSIGKAHRVERQASETEAQRRQSARLLHDTVLATLTLLAHSGVGVAPDALRQQAADDARLLRQLRLGATPAPLSSGAYNLEPVEETVLGTTLESVKHRFGRMGLEVNWHGTGQVLLPSDVLDAFLLALAECLENVRRHSGVRQADVTITDDTTTVRAMVTDSGVGFDLAGIDEDKLGFTESVVGRLREVGGNARLFSSEGSGTTVVLEVPK